MAANRIIELEGRGQVTLSPANHLATGGEASVYRSGDTIVKIYLDEKKMARDGMVEKVKLLKPLKTKTIMAPEGVVLDKRTQAPLGFYLPFVEGEPLPRVFTSSFWQRTPFTYDQANVVVDKMRETVVTAHANYAVMVDANELNWLMSQQSEPTPHVIDVDSWAVGKWGAKVIMLSIRDWHTKDFNQQSDWFSWAVVTFQLYTGIHPYKGTVDGYKSSEWERRMKDNVSVFSSGVRLNAAVRDINKIPGVLRGWYEAVFQRGERCVPPSPFAKSITVQKAAVIQHVTTTNATGLLSMEKVFDEYPVRKMWPCSAVLVQASSGVQVWDVKRKRKLFDVKPRVGAFRVSACEVIRVADGWVMAVIEGRDPRFYFAGDVVAPQVEMDLRLSGNTLFRYENRIFLSTNTELLELGYVRAARPMISVKQSISILHPQAVQWFDGVGVERAFTATFIITPMRENACATVRVPELDGLHVIAAKAGKRFAAFVCEDKSGDLHRIELTFDEDYTSYKAWTGLTDQNELNMTFLPKGVGATIVKDGQLVVFVPTTNTIKRIDDRTISTRMLLGNFGDAVVYLDGGIVWILKMN